MWWLHTETTYSFHGDAPIAGLVPIELDVLRLGHIVHQEQQHASREGTTTSMERAKRERRQAHLEKNREMFGEARPTFGPQ